MSLFSHLGVGKHEAVEIREKRFGYFPKAFCWHGRLYDVKAVEQCWTSVNGSPRLCFRVRCDEGTFHLVQNVRDNTWHLTRLAQKGSL